MSKIIVLCFALLSLVACGGKKDCHSGEGKTTDAKATSGAKFGKELNADGAISPQDLVSKLNAKEGFTEVSLEEGAKEQGLADVKVKGQVTAVCKSAGCWFTLQTTDGKEIFVRVRDHAFAMPADLEGKTVVAQGHAYQRVIPVEELRHLAEDAKASKAEIEAITQPETKYELLITGAMVL
jgi:hypothetical protein